LALKPCLTGDTWVFFVTFVPEKKKINAFFRDAIIVWTVGIAGMGEEKSEKRAGERKGGRKKGGGGGGKRGKERRRGKEKKQEGKRGKNGTSRAGRAGLSIFRKRTFPVYVFRKLQHGNLNGLAMNYRAGDCVEG